MRWGVDEKSTTDGEKEVKKAGDLICHIQDIWHPEQARELGVRARTSIHRARLLEELVALLPPCITTFSKTFENLEEQPDGSIKLHFADGTHAFASAVIGADGIKSRVREIVCGPHIQARYSSECAYRSVVPRHEAIAALGEDAALNGTLYCGHGGYIITYPIEHGELINMVLIAHDDDLTSATMPMQDRSRDEWNVPTTTAEMTKTFAAWYAPLISVAAEFTMPAKWLLFDLQHNAPYHKGKICLVGDSAHATTPHLGAGAGQAMEDAFVLSSLMASVSGVDEVERAFRAFEEVRRGRTQGVVKRSAEATRGYGFVLEGVGEDAGRLKEVLGEAFRWVWHGDLEEEVRVARGLLERSRVL